MQICSRNENVPFSSWTIHIIINPDAPSYGHSINTLWFSLNSIFIGSEKNFAKRPNTNYCVTRWKMNRITVSGISLYSHEYWIYAIDMCVLFQSEVLEICRIQNSVAFFPRNIFQIFIAYSILNQLFVVTGWHCLLSMNVLIWICKNIVIIWWAIGNVHNVGNTWRNPHIRIYYLMWVSYFV